MNKVMLEELQQRGLLQQCTGQEALQQLLDAGPQTVYTGYDPTGDSLHIGHLVTLMALRRLHAAGHHVVVLLGGGTALVGDPSGKTAMRPMLDAATIDANAKALLSQVQRVLGGGERLSWRNNAAWLTPLGYLDFLRNVGRHFSVNRMLTAETYRARLETGLSFLEFNYQLLQAYDFLHLAKTDGVRLQLGGDDQWGNILAGVELCRRSARIDAHGLTVPLLTTASGAKMGKTAAGAVWLDADKLHPNDFFQYWVNVDDRDIGRFLRIYTLLPEAEIAAATAEGAFGPNAQKRVLAYEVTALVHGPEAAACALRAAASAFAAVALDAALLPTSQVPRSIAVNADDAPRHALEASMGPGPWGIARVLQALGWVKSANEARRLIAQGAVKLGETAVTDSAQQLRAADLPAAGLPLRAGKKKRVTLLP